MPGKRIEAATNEIARRDPVMASLIERGGPCGLPGAPLRSDPFTALAESIAYQQLAGKAAAAIWGRLMALFDGQGFTPQNVLDMPPETMRTAGMSGAKVASIRDLAEKVVDGTVPTQGFGRLSDDEIVECLTAVRGIGRWTVEMFLLFDLGRLDVWPVDDYGVRKGYALAYGLGEPPKPKDLMARGEAFSPYRSVAAWYCWKAVDLGLGA